jgi:hypothetical protein
MAEKKGGTNDGKEAANKPKRNSKQKPKRGPRGAFLPGNKEGAAGRPKGSRNRTTLMVERMIEDDAEELTRALIDRAKKGFAVPLLFERLAPARRDRHVTLQLPPLTVTRCKTCSPRKGRSSSTSPAGS